MCVDIDLVGPTIPTLPDPLSIPGLATSPIEFAAELCCKFDLLSVVPLTLLPPTPIPTAVVALLNTALIAVGAYTTAKLLTFECPLQ